MKNNFPQKVFDLFDFGGWCPSWESNNNADCLHHILGRVSNSPYNACPLNNFKEHQPEGRTSLNLAPLSAFKVKAKYLVKTKKYLAKIGYKPNRKDLKFLADNKQYYGLETINK